MKHKVLFIIIALIALTLSCKKDKDNPVVSIPVIDIDKTSLDFGEVVKGQSISETITLSNFGDDYFEWSYSTDKDWISLTPENGTVEESDVDVTVTVDTSPLGVGSHSGTITISSDTEGVQGSPVDILVTLEISSEIEIPGHELTENETWSGNITLKGDIKITTGNTLTIEPGTVIKVTDEYPDWDGGFKDDIVDIYVQGNLVAHGTENDIIVFTVDSENPEMDDWWGFGLSSNSSVNLKYCCIAYSDYGLFVFTTSPNTPVVENCMFAYSSGIVDFGPNSDISHTTFINGNYGYVRWEEYRTADISYCVFENNSGIDVRALDSYNDVTIDNSNFVDNGGTNLQISSSFSPDNVTITANNCYGISTTDDNGCGTITVNNPESSPIATAGCGFDISELPLKTTATKRAKSTYEDLIKEEELMKYYNEIEKNHE